MKTFKASTLGGHLAFKPTIRIDTYGVTFKIPGLFSNEEKTVDFENITSVSFIGGIITKDVIITISGSENIKAEGFSASDAIEIKRIIENEKMKPNNSKTSDKNKIDVVFVEKEESPEDEYIRKKNSIDLQNYRKEKELEFQQKELEFQQKEKETIITEKKRLISENKTLGHFFIFWRYFLNKTWKKIVFIIFVFLLVRFVFTVFTDCINKDSEKNKLQEVYLNLKVERLKVDSVIQYGNKAEAEDAVYNFERKMNKLETTNRFLKSTVKEWTDELNWDFTSEKYKVANIKEKTQ